MKNNLDIDSSPSSVANIFEVSEHEALEALPGIFRTVAQQLHTNYGVPTRAVAATALAVATNALGSTAVVKGVKTEKYFTLAFNLILGIRGERSPAWLNILTASLYDQIFHMQQLYQELEPEGLKRKAKELTSGLRAAQQSPNPSRPLIAQLTSDALLFEAALKPVAFTNQLTTKRIAQALKLCFDGAVFLADPALDPAATFLTLPVTERQGVARALNASWRGEPLSLGNHIYDGALSLFWTIDEALLLPLFDSESLTGAFAVPTLWVSSPKNALVADRHGIPDAKDWSNFVKRMFGYRLSKNESKYTLSEEAARQLCDFERELTATDSSLAWLSELAVRFSAFFELLKEQQEVTTSGGSASAAITVTKWLAAEHLELQRRFQSPQGPSADNAANTDKRTPEDIMFTKIQRKGPLNRRELWRSYNKPRAHEFQKALDALVGSGKILQTQDGKLIVAENVTVRQ